MGSSVVRLDGGAAVVVAGEVVVVAPIVVATVVSSRRSVVVSLWRPIEPADSRADQQGGDQCGNAAATTRAGGSAHRCRRYCRWPRRCSDGRHGRGIDALDQRHRHVVATGGRRVGKPRRQPRLDCIEPCAVDLVAQVDAGVGAPVRVGERVGVAVGREDERVG